MDFDFVGRFSQVMSSLIHFGHYLIFLGRIASIRVMSMGIAQGFWGRSRRVESVMNKTF
jgi:hypothetical protein